MLLAGVFEVGHRAVASAFRAHEIFSEDVSEEGLWEMKLFRMQNGKRLRRLMNLFKD